MAVDPFSISSKYGITSPLHLIPYIQVSMHLKCGQSVLPHTLQLDEGQVLTLPDTVNNLQAKIIIPTPGKMFSQFGGLIINLLPVPTMPHMHAVDGLACILHATSTGDEIDTVT